MKFNFYFASDTLIYTDAEKAELNNWNFQLS